jgi:elongation factor Ts
MAYAVVENGIGVVIEVNAETDFVAKNDLFIEFVKGAAAVVAEKNPAALDSMPSSTRARTHG